MPMRDRLNDAVYGARRSAIREFSRLAAHTPDCVRLTLGEPDFATPAPICAAAGDATDIPQASNARRDIARMNPTPIPNDCRTSLSVTAQPVQ